MLLGARNTRIAALEAELAAAKAEPATTLENGKSLADVVCRMRQQGKTDEEIAAYLYDGGKWCSQAQVGALLHADENRIKNDSMKKAERRLLGLE